ncbi:glucokinase [Frankineae bacterium MT45]|nr:glucokinase [Frankineae bacterium MT45]
MTERGSTQIGRIVGALEVGGTHVAATAVDTGNWQLLAPIQRVSLDPAGSADALTDGMASCARAVLTAAPILQLTSWGVAMPGPFDYATGIARYTGVGKFESLDGVAVGGRLRDGLFGTAGQRDAEGAVRFGNDADAFAIGEYLAGATRGISRTAAITLGSGIGSCFLADGQPVDTGDAVPPGGEAHLIRVDGVPLEEIASRRAILSAYLAATGKQLDVKEIADRARHGQAAAVSVLDDYASTLGGALGPNFARFGVEKLVVGGSIAGAWDLFDPAFRAALPDPELAIAISADAERSGLIGAASLALT